MVCRSNYNILHVLLRQKKRKEMIMVPLILTVVENGIRATAAIVFMAAAAICLLFVVSLAGICGIYASKVCNSYFAPSDKEFASSVSVHRHNYRSIRLLQEQTPVSVSGVSSVSQDLFSHHHLPQDLVLQICSFLHPRSVTTIACINRASKILVDGISDTSCDVNTNKRSGTTISGALWSSLWLRDYGSVLLDWDVSRNAFRKSLASASQPNSSLDSNPNASDVEGSARITVTVAKLIQESIESMVKPKEFYFQFQYSFVDYVLAGHNTPNKCLMGIHGHIIDFTDFAPSHPGLSEPIVVEGGRDVTEYFEDVTIRHSKSARAIARKLCLVVDRSCWRKRTQHKQQIYRRGNVCNANDNDNGNDNEDEMESELECCGLYRPTSTTAQARNTSFVLRQSNTRPPSHDPREVKLGLDKIFPMESFAKPRRPATLCVIRDRYNDSKQLAEAWAKRQPSMLTRGMGTGGRCDMRVYYDPFAKQWKGWYSDINWNPIFCDIDAKE